MSGYKPIISSMLHLQTPQKGWGAINKEEGRAWTRLRVLLSLWKLPVPHSPAAVVIPIVGKSCAHVKKVRYKGRGGSKKIQWMEAHRSEGGRKKKEDQCKVGISVSRSQRQEMKQTIHGKLQELRNEGWMSHEYRHICFRVNLLTAAKTYSNSWLHRSYSTAHSLWCKWFSIPSAACTSVSYTARGEYKICEYCHQTSTCSC